jgi:hemolysin activation/secretion protein
LDFPDRPLRRFYAGFDDTGMPVTGRDRYSVGFNWGNVFGLDHQFSYQFITSPDLWRTCDRGTGHSNDPRFVAHSASYMAPMPWGDFVSIFGTYVAQAPDLGLNFDQVGHSLQLSLRYEHPFASFWNISHQLQIGFDYKRSDNNLSFGGTNIFAAATNIEQFLLDYGATRPDDWGQTTIENQFYWSPGGLSHGNTTSVFVASGVTGAMAGYIYDNLQLTRVTYLPWEMSLVLRVDAQLASTELLPSEQIGAGGPDSVRGYDPRMVNGTQGALASVELRSPSYAPLKSLGLPVDDSGQVLTFFDSGFVPNRHAQTGQPKSATLESAGVGVRYGVGRYLDVRFDYGWQIDKAPGASKRRNLAHVAVTLAY